MLRVPGTDEHKQEKQQKLFNTLVALSGSLRKARITLSSVDPAGTEDAISYRTEFYPEFTKGVFSARNMEIGNLALQVLALQSGGRVLNASNNVTAQIACRIRCGVLLYAQNQLAIQRAP
jgi:hypothetical protein